MKIENFDLDQKIMVIAEIGNNHEGQFDVAEEMVRQAAACGVDAVKFQTFRTEKYVSSVDEARFNRLKEFELTFDQFSDLSVLAHDLGILFISTPLDMESAEFLETIVDSYKIASGDVNFYPMIGMIARTGKPMIISTGLSDYEQIEKTVKYINKQSAEARLTAQYALLHCVTSYPVPPEQANLLAIQFMADHFDCPVGYSDHTNGIEAAVIAAALGARIIEKHFTLDKNYSDFRDHQLSADPAEMAELVRKIRLLPLLLGGRDKDVQACEKPLLSIRRSIAAARDLPQGRRIEGDDLMWIRPAGGLPPGEEEILLGKTLKSAVKFGEQILALDVV